MQIIQKENYSAKLHSGIKVPTTTIFSEKMQEYAQFLVCFFTWRKAILACSSAFSTSHWDLSISNLKQLKNMYFRLCTLIKLKKKSSPKIFLRFSNKLYKLQLRLIISLGGGKGGGGGLYLDHSCWMKWRMPGMLYCPSTLFSSFLYKAQQISERNGNKTLIASLNNLFFLVVWQLLFKQTL